MPSSPLIVALDFSTREDALALARQLDPQLCRVKVANTLFTRCGPSVIDALQQLGFEVFLDLKYHDIPHQVAGSCIAAAQLGVWMITIHCAGGEAMMQAAREALETVKGPRPLLVGVTVLTSLSHEDLQQIGYRDSLMQSVLNLGQLAKRSGLDGVVCSAMEVSELRRALGDDFILVTPGIRFSDHQEDDQKRVMTPQQAIQAGSTYLVMGRALTEAKEPLLALQTCYKQIG